MSIIPPEALDYIGMKTEAMFASETVEAGAVRRFSQAIMDHDPAYGADSTSDSIFGGPIAPPLFPQWMFRRKFDDPDVIQANAENPDFDGASASSIQGLPPIEAFRGFGVLNGGSEIEFYRYARHGERVRITSSYESIVEKQTSKGPIALIIIASEYRTEADDLLLVVRRTSIRRPVK